MKLKDYYRQKVSVDEYPEKINFQALDWSTREYTRNNKELTSIVAFGVTDKGHSISCEITGFQPFFYIKLPENWSKTKSLLEMFKKNLDIELCKETKKKNIYGFKGEIEERFLKLCFNSEKDFKKLRYKFNNPIFISGKRYKFDTFESNLPPLLRFFHVSGILPCGFISLKKFSEPKTSISNCQLEVKIDFHNVKQGTEFVAPFLQVSFDIECFSKDGSFPDPSVPENVITHISSTFKTNGKLIMKNTVSLNSNKMKMGPNEFHKCVDSERKLIEYWGNLILKMDPDILYQYNGDTFDGNYIYVRAKKLKIDTFWTKLKNERCEIASESFSSNAYGTSFFKRLKIVGRINFDVMVYFKRNFKESSYKLDDISKKYIGNQKNEMTVQEMFDSYGKGDYELSRKVAEYCIQDSVLPLLLVEKFNILQAQISMCNVTFVPFSYLIYRGQQIKVFSQLVKYANSLNFVVPTLKNEYNSEKFIAATVLEPMKGAYYEPISVLDFASLYPSIIRAHNLCYSSIVLDDKYKNLPGYNYQNFKNEETGQEITFVENCSSVLPDILATMAISRKNEKKLMKLAKDPLQKTIHDMNQNAYKISMNSLYGFLAANTLKCTDIASTVTTVGRKMINETVKCVEENFDGAKVVYGDSVTEDSEIILRGNEITKTTFKDAFSESNFYKDKKTQKEYYVPENLEIFSSKGYTKIINVIRHYTDKEIYKITTEQGVVKVTKDHSLIELDGKIIKPQDLLVGKTELLWKVNKDNGPNNSKNNLKTNLVLKIEKEPNKFRWVYDLTTETNDFACGIGHNIVHNTDSVFIKFFDKDKGPLNSLVEKSKSCGFSAAEKATKLFKDPIKLEFEKIYLPFLLFSKKKYCGTYIPLDSSEPFFDSKGVILKRRDNCLFLRETWQKISDLILISKKEEAISYIEQVVKKMRENKEELDIDKFSISKTLNAEYKSKNLPHVVVAEKKRERGEEVNVNERIQYVFVKGEKQVKNQYEKAECASYAKKFNLILDVEYYIQKQLRNPITELLLLITNESQINEIFDDPEKIRMKNEKIRIREQKKRELEILKEQRAVTRSQKAKEKLEKGKKVTRSKKTEKEQGTKKITDFFYN